MSLLKKGHIFSIFFLKQIGVTSWGLWRALVPYSPLCLSAEKNSARAMWWIRSDLFSSVQFSCSVMSDSLWPLGLHSPWASPGLSLLQGIFPTQGLNPGLQHCRRILYQLSYQEGRTKSIFMGLGVCFEYSPHYDNRRELMSIVVLVQSLSCVWLFATPQRIACQDPWSMGFPRQECWHGLPFTSPGDLPNPGIKPMSSEL